MHNQMTFDAEKVTHFQTLTIGKANQSLGLPATERDVYKNPTGTSEKIRKNKNLCEEFHQTTMKIAIALNTSKGLTYGVFFFR